MVKNLKNLFPYNKIKPPLFRPSDIRQLKSNPVDSKDDWSEQCYTSLKRYVRSLNYISQKRRCVYCRRTLNPKGINEHLDHIVARSIAVGWMFKPRNLVLSCYQCNTQKSATPTLKSTKKFKRLPRRGRHYLLFNPYVHNWSDHFDIEDDLFLTAKSKIGEFTINELKLYDHKYSMVFAEESNCFGKTAIVRATLRMRSYSPISNEYKSAKRLIKEIEKHI